MNKLKINLNLLRALDILLREKNVTNAGKVLHLSQSAMSNALAQCRELFHDELLVRHSGGMGLTPQGQYIRDQLHPLLKDIESLVESAAHFNPSTTQRRFVIGFNDGGWASRRILPKLIQLTQEIAPNISYDIKNLDQQIQPSQSNEISKQHQQLDMILGFFPVKIPNYEKVKLYHTEIVCAAHKNHPYLTNPSLDNYLSSQHLIVSDPNFQPTFTDEYLHKNYNIKRNIAMRLASVHQAYDVLPYTNFLATLPLSLIKDHTREGISYAPTPFNGTESAEAVSMIWDERRSNDKGHRWLRECIFSICDQF